MDGATIAMFVFQTVITAIIGVAAWGVKNAIGEMKAAVSELKAAAKKNAEEIAAVRGELGDLKAMGFFRHVGPLDHDLKNKALFRQIGVLAHQLECDGILYFPAVMPLLVDAASANHARGNSGGQVHTTVPDGAENIGA